MNRVKKYFDGHRYMFTFFFVIFVAQFVGNGDGFSKVDMSCYTIHILDYKSIGIVSRVLPGQIYLFFFKNPSIKTLTGFCIVLLTAVFLCASYFLEKIYKAAPETHKLSYLYFIVLFCVSGGVFHIYFSELGMFDIYWIYAFIIFLFLLRSKKTWALIPLCYVFMVAVHYASVLCFVPLMSIIILYEIADCSEESEKRQLAIVFVVSMIFTFSAIAVFMYNEEHNLKLTMEEMHKLLNSRGSDYYSYYDYAFFKTVVANYHGADLNIEEFQFIKAGFVPGFIKNLINNIAFQVYFGMKTFIDTKYVEDFPLTIVVTMIAAGLPGLVFFYKCFHRLYKTVEHKLKKFALFCAMALFPFSFLTSSLMSLDNSRFFCDSFISTFIMFLYLLYREKEKFGGYVVSVFSKIKQSYLLLYLLCSFLVRFHPYI